MQINGLVMSELVMLTAVGGQHFNAMNGVFGYMANTPRRVPSFSVSSRACVCLCVCVTTVGGRLFIVLWAVSSGGCTQRTASTECVVTISRLNNSFNNSLSLGCVVTTLFAGCCRVLPRFLASLFHYCVNRVGRVSCFPFLRARRVVRIVDQ